MERRRLPILALAFALIATVAACSDDGGDEPADTTTSADTAGADTRTDSAGSDVATTTSSADASTSGDTTDASGTDVSTTVATDASGQDIPPVDAVPTDTSDTGADTSVGDTSVDSADSPDSPDTTDTMQPGCDRNGFVVGGQAAEGEAGFLAWYAATGTQPPFERATFEVLDLPRMPFQHVFDGENYKTCDVCLTFGTACDTDGCARTFLAVDGDVNVTGWGTVGESFTAAFTGIRAVEVTVADDFTSTEVADGEVWCVGAFDADVAIQQL